MEIDKLKHKLLEAKAVLETRVEKLEKDKKRSGKHLDPDSQEQAIETQNDQVVDHLDHLEREELTKIYKALNKIEHGEYGVCEECGNNISESRLNALPYADICIECAESN